MPLGKELGLGTGQIVLDGDPVETQPPCLLWPNSRPSQQLLSSCYRYVVVNRRYLRMWIKI